MSFDRLHPSIRHHIVNSLGWSSLRALQEQAIEPILAGEDAVLIAPTAGGKTEAALFPVLSRMLEEDWRGLSVLYVCPIKALLNNLQHRLQRYGALVGRSCEVWHGDVGQSARKRIRSEPPDVLLTTPESIEAQLVSRRTSPEVLFADVRVVIIDEVHAFAGDDRGWHLLAVLARLQNLTGRRIQRVGLSATVGNPERILHWLSTPGSAGRVVNPERGAMRVADVQLDYVGSLQNAAQVISQLHRGFKRLVFCDSRAAAEELAGHLTSRETRTYVSHSSLSKESRHAAEQAFSEARDCVIVATSTLELGIDVGDLDYVIQIDAPRAVASFLQRMGRTGRRPGTSPNCLFLATWPESLVQAAAIVELWEKGYVEPVEPPPAPLHILAQQIMAQALQRDGVTRDDWAPALEPFLERASLTLDDGRAILDHMVATGLFTQDGGVHWFGARGEEEFGHRNFMDLLSVFASEELFEVRHGRQQVGFVDRVSFAGKKDQDERRALLLGGRAWEVRDIDWDRALVQVVPATGIGKSRWKGESPALSFDLCQAMQRVLASEENSPRWSRRAAESMHDSRRDFWYVQADSTCLLTTARSSFEWWTFAGLHANLQLAAALEAALPVQAQAENLSVQISGEVSVSDLSAQVGVSSDQPVFFPGPLLRLADGLKFGTCLPALLTGRLLASRYSATKAVVTVLDRTVRSVATT